jgi:hypothetical protein
MTLEPLYSSIASPMRSSITSRPSASQYWAVMA